jgi:TonB family protein
MLFRIFNKTNTKKPPYTILMLTPDKTMYVALMLSVLIHALAIYTIPAVEIFSEGDLGRVTEDELIMVEMVQPEVAEQPAPPSENLESQFQSQPLEAVAAPAVPPQDAVDTLPEPEPEPPAAGYTLLAEMDAPDPEIEQLQKRPSQHKRPPMKTLRPESPRPAEKLTALKPEDLPQPPAVNTPERPAVPLKRTERPQPQMTPAEALHFPLTVSQPQDRPNRARSDELPQALNLEKQGFSKIREQADRPLLHLDPDAQRSTRTRFGITKEDETDTNRFGIFAGRKFEMPQMKETVQEVEEEKQTTVQAPETETAKKLLQTNNQIEGPVKGRAIVYQPPPPSIDIDIEVELQLKFWVLPDGTIGEVIPIKRGDATLERIAIAYLKKWQFEPLPPDAPQQKIWGTIPIRFTVR